MYMKHLLGGVAKGAFTEAEAEARFNKWVGEKQAKIDAKSNKLVADANSAKKAQAAAEAAATAAEEATEAVAEETAEA